MLKIVWQNSCSAGYNIMLDNGIMLYIHKTNPTQEEIDTCVFEYERDQLNKVDLLGEENDVYLQSVNSGHPDGGPHPPFGLS